MCGAADAVLDKQLPQQHQHLKRKGNTGKSGKPSACRDKTAPATAATAATAAKASQDALV